jgi:hypothetical protein
MNWVACLILDCMCTHPNLISSQSCWCHSPLGPSTNKRCYGWGGGEGEDIGGIEGINSLASYLVLTYIYIYYFNSKLWCCLVCKGLALGTYRMNTFVVFGTLRLLRSWHISCGISIRLGGDRQFCNNLVGYYIPYGWIRWRAFNIL